MAYFEWWKDMEVDQGGPIDQDHQKLVEQVNLLHTATSEGRGMEVVGELLEALIKDTIEHVRREEQYLHSLGFPELPGHQKGHERFVNDLLGLQERYKAGRIGVASQLSNTLRDWLSIHIRRNDKAVTQFMKKKKMIGSMN